ncbi:MAG: hypothetical protein R3C10_03265 [Pirellulales bacterium]
MTSAAGPTTSPPSRCPTSRPKTPPSDCRWPKKWYDRFDANNNKWLKSTIATLDGEEPVLTYEDVDTSLIALWPRLYGLVGAEVIEQVWKRRVNQRTTDTSGNGHPAAQTHNRGEQLTP